MGRRCRLERPGFAGPAEWTLDERALTLRLEGGGVEVVALAEVAAVGGDDRVLRLRLGSARLTLSKLGGDGPNLLADLHRWWLPARVEALRLASGGEGRRLRGAWAWDEAPPRPASFLPLPHALLVAPDDGELEPLFLALVDGVSFDSAAHAVVCQGADGRVARVSRLGARTDQLRTALAEARSSLAAEAAATLGRWLSTLDPARRVALAAAWPPGRLVSLAELERLAPGCGDALALSWLPALPRREQYRHLVGWAEPGQAWLGHAAGAGDEPGLWLLAGRGQRWLLEAVGEEDWATYRFAAGSELPGLVSALLCAPQFSREALYLPLAELAGERGELAIAARSLPFLVALRERFRGRVVHSSIAHWQAGLDAP